MARRCGVKNGKSVCQKPRANWWKDAMGIDWMSGSGSSGGGAPGDWILATGFWNDSNFWRDESVWID